MAKYVTKRLFKPKKGIDLKSSEILRGENYLTYAQNVVWDGQSNLAKRPGTHLRVYGAPAFSGLLRFDSTNYNGVAKSELLMIGDSNPLKVVKNTLTITNSSGASVTLSTLFDPLLNQYVFTLTGNVIYAQNLGFGTLGGDPTIANLVAGLPVGIVGVASGNTSVPAAFMETLSITLVNGSSVVIPYYSTQDLVWGGKNTAPTMLGVEPRVNPQYAIVNRSLYWYGSHTGAQTNLFKYDGSKWYAAGLPAPETLTVSAYIADGVTYTDARGTYTSLDYTTAFNLDEANKYACRYVYKDFAGALHYSEFQYYNLLTSPAAKANGGIGLYIDDPDTFNRLDYKNARSAIANGAQASTLTITVNAGHTLLPGDIAYFWWRAGSGGGFFIEREIVTVGATSITISATPIIELDTGGPISVLDNCVISNNFRVEYYYVNQSSGLVDNNIVLSADLAAVVPFDSLTASGARLPDIYINTKDTTATEYISAIGSSSYTYPGVTSYEPPKGKYVSATSNGSSIILAGDETADNIVYCSTTEDPEAFFLGRNSFSVDERITALGTSGSVAIVGTFNKTYAVNGDIPSLNFRVEKITENLGIYSAPSVTEVDEGAIYFVTHRGPMLLLAGRDLKPVGIWDEDKTISVIEPYFTHIYDQTIPNPSFNVTSSYVIKERKWIITNVPWYLGSAFSAVTSGTWVFDYGMGGWTLWSGVDASCGAAYWDGKIWLAGQAAGQNSNLVTMTEQNESFNFSDHGTAITSIVRYHWENGGDINLYKKFLWLTIHTPCGYSVPYNLDVKTYANYEIVKANAFSIPTAQHTSFSKYAMPPAYTVEAKLRTGKMSGLMVEVSNGNVNEGLWIGGTEIDIAADFQTPSRPGRSDS